MLTGSHGPLFWPAPNNLAGQPEVSVLPSHGAMAAQGHRRMLGTTAAAPHPLSAALLQHSAGDWGRGDLRTAPHKPQQPVTAGTHMQADSILPLNARASSCSKSQAWEVWVECPSCIPNGMGIFWVEIMPRMSVFG